MAKAHHPFDAFIDRAADLLAARIRTLLADGQGMEGTRARGGEAANEKRRMALLGRKLDMSCRVAGCKERSGGPSAGYMCRRHQKLPRAEQAAAREAWRATRQRN